MDNIIYNFDEKVISLMKNFLFNLEGEQSLSDFTYDLVGKFAELERNIIPEII